MCFLIPAAFIHACSGCWIIHRRSPTNIRPSFCTSPHSSSASSLIGSVASVSVFSVQIRIHQPPSLARSISSQRSFNMSLMRSPVRHENRAARFNTSYWQGVAASCFTSSSVRNSLWLLWVGVSPNFIGLQSVLNLWIDDFWVTLWGNHAVMYLWEVKALKFFW